MKWREKCRRAASILRHTKSLRKTPTTSAARRNWFSEEGADSEVTIWWPDYQNTFLSVRDDLKRAAHKEIVHDGARLTKTIERSESDGVTVVYMDSSFSRTITSGTCTSLMTAYVNMLLILDIYGLVNEGSV